MRRERPAFERRVRKELARGNTVVIDNINAEIDSIFSEEDILRDRKFDPHKLYDIHSKSSTMLPCAFPHGLSLESKKRMTNFERPQVPGSLREFFSSVTDHKEVNFVLDVPAVVTDSPWIIRCVRRHNFCMCLMVI